ncbi:MAG: hypothetical protein KDE54_06205, partial [Caldilineaceae bacterium]|nr:hypothetical protein [Caldilineaceae bacterium]MCB0142940.1 hypothetical protein [Caldilineaceae bacterium]
ALSRNVLDPIVTFQTASESDICSSYIQLLYDLRSARQAPKEQLLAGFVIFYSRLAEVLS